MRLVTKKILAMAVLSGPLGCGVDQPVPLANPISREPAKRTRPNVAVIGLHLNDPLGVSNGKVSVEMTKLIREAVANRTEWSLDRREYNLLDLMIANQCATPDRACLNKISSFMSHFDPLDAIVYGTVTEVSTGLLLELWSIVFATKGVEHWKMSVKSESELPGAATDAVDTLLP